MQKKRLSFTILTVTLILVFGVLLWKVQSRGTEQNIKKNPMQIQVNPLEQSLTASSEEVQKVDVGTAPKFDKYTIAIMVDSVQVGIGDREDKINLFRLLGSPITEETEVTGPEAFPYENIKFKTVEYDGLTVTFNESKDGFFVVCNIVTTNEKYPTPLGVQVGDSLDKLLELYPAQNREEGYGPGVYTLFGDHSGWGMYFYIEEEVIAKIEINAEWD